MDRDGSAENRALGTLGRRQRRLTHFLEVGQPISDVQSDGSDRRRVPEADAGRQMRKIQSYVRFTLRHIARVDEESGSERAVQRESHFDGSFPQRETAEGAQAV